MNELDLGEFFGDYIDSRIDIMIEEKVDEKVNRRLKEIFEGETVMDLITSTEYRYCSRKELSEILEVSPQTITNRTRTGQYNPIIKGNSNLYDLHEVRVHHPEQVDNYFRYKLQHRLS